MAKNGEIEGTGFKQDIHRLGQGVEALTTEVKHVVHEAADVARSGASELRDGAQHAVEVAKEKFDGARDGAVHAAESLKQTVVRHPMASVGIAAGVGMVLALILFRPRS